MKKKLIDLEILKLPIKLPINELFQKQNVQSHFIEIIAHKLTRVFYKFKNYKISNIIFTN